MRIDIAQVHEITTVLALVEELLAELGEEGQEFAGIDRERLEADVARNLGTAPGSGRFWALLARDDSGTAIGVLTLSASFALHAGGEYGVIDEMYVRPQYRSRGVGRDLVDAAAAIARQRRWFRLDVTGPVASPAGPGGSAGSEVRADLAKLGGRTVRFYEKLGFEFTGPKLRRLI